MGFLVGESGHSNSNELSSSSISLSDASRRRGGVDTFFMTSYGFSIDAIKCFSYSRDSGYCFCCWFGSSSILDSSSSGKVLVSYNLKPRPKGEEVDAAACSENLKEVWESSLSLSFIKVLA